MVSAVSTEDIPESLSMQIQKYIKDPATRVYIKHNRDTGEWLYSVVVENSGDFWLDSFKTEKAALNYIEKCKLKMSGGCLS